MKLKLVYKLFLLGVFSIALLGCKKEISAEEQFQKDREEIIQFIEAHELDAIETESGLFYVIEKLGTGNFPNSKDNVRVRYTGYTTDLSIFDQSDEVGASFNLQGVIKGWTEGIQKFKEGGKGMLLIPSELGYGKEGSGSVAPNSVLIFDIELLTIE